jgi:hypothetical protein
MGTPWSAPKSDHDVCIASNTGCPWVCPHASRVVWMHPDVYGDEGAPRHPWSATGRGGGLPSYHFSLPRRCTLEPTRLALDATRAELRRTAAGHLMLILRDSTAEVELPLSQPGLDRDVLLEVSALAQRLDWATGQVP